VFDAVPSIESEAREMRDKKVLPSRQATDSRLRAEREKTDDEYFTLPDRQLT